MVTYACRKRAQNFRQPVIKGSYCIAKDELLRVGPAIYLQVGYLSVPVTTASVVRTMDFEILYFFPDTPIGKYLRIEGQQLFQFLMYLQ